MTYNVHFILFLQLNGDRDEQEIFFDLTTLLDKAFFGKDPVSKIVYNY